MNIQKVQQFNTSENRQYQPQFTGPVDAAVNAAATALRFLDTNQAIGACAVDLGCMVAPRTITDFSRGSDAGFETLRRESTGTLNHASIGPIYGGLAGLLLANTINSEYGIDATKVFADAETIEMMSKIQYDNLKAGKNSAEFAKTVASSISTPNHGKLSRGVQKNFAETLVKLINPPEELKGLDLYRYNKQHKELLRNIILSNTGEETNITLKYEGKELKSSLNAMVDNVSSLSKTLFKEKVVDSFSNAKSFADVSFVKSLKNFGMKRSLLGLAMGTAVGCSIQPINIYLTKKKTGSDGFVGVEGREKDNSKGFKALKAAAAGAFALFAIGSIGKPKNLLKNIQYKSLVPTLEQFKLVYGLTISSRFLAARDKDELREAVVKDTLGFSTWLLLGNFVAKGTLKGLSKMYKKRHGVDLNIIGKTRDEVLHTRLKELKAKTVENGKALSYVDLLKKLPESDKLTKTKLKYFSLAQLAGYAFSALVLGVGIPKLNIYMTNKSEQKRAQQRTMNPQFNMFKPENLAFLSKEMNFTSKKMLNN